MRGGMPRHGTRYMVESNTDPSGDEVIAQLDRILSNPEFAQSARAKRFLKFVVDQTLAGRAKTLKEYAIALDVFERDESFDPQTSSIVRVEASRLRDKLEKYNALDGRDDPVHIGLPAGSYVPVFARNAAGRKADQTSVARPPAVTPDRPASRLGLLATILLLAFIAAPTAYILFNFFSAERDPDGPPITSQSAGTNSIVVLPLRNLSGDVDQEFFGDGITDALITKLAKNGRLRVISTRSALAYKNAERPVADIARELNVSHVIEGALVRVGDKVRITAQLIDATTNQHLWAESFEHDITDIMAIQNEVVERIVSSFSNEVAAASGPRLDATPKIDPIAYEAQLKGRFFRDQLTEQGLKKGIVYFREAIRMAPKYAPAYSGMAACYCLLGGHGLEVIKPSEALPDAKQAILEAMKLDDSLAEPHAFLGIIRLKYEWDWPGAEASIRHSIELNPNYVQARLFYSFFLEAMGRQDAAIREAKIAKSIDPISLGVNVNLGWQYLRAGQLEAARRVFEETSELSPNFWGVHWGLGHYHRLRGEYDEAIASFQTAIQVGGGHTLPLSALGYTYALASKPDEALAMIDQLKEIARDTYVSPFNMATIYAGLGDKDQTFEWLEKAYADRSRSLVWLNVATEYDGLRQDPRFESISQRIGLPSEPS